MSHLRKLPSRRIRLRKVSVFARLRRDRSLEQMKLWRGWLVAAIFTLSIIGTSHLDAMKRSLDLSEEYHQAFFDQEESVEKMSQRLLLDTQSLTSWSQAVFKHLPEYAHGMVKGDYPKPLFTASEFQDLAQEFITGLTHDCFNKPQDWLNNKMPSNILNQSQSPTYDLAHVQRKTIAPQSAVCFIGDIHGSIHSLLRILWRLVQLGKLTDDFNITDAQFYIVFNGDFVDRGRYGIEVWHTLLHLKNVNPDQVFLLRGNHEDCTMQQQYGFAGTLINKLGQVNLNAGELYSKFGNEADSLRTTIGRLCNFLPHALYLGSGSDGQSYYFQCCHGGIEIGFDPIALLTQVNDCFQLIPQGINAHQEAHQHLFAKTNVIAPYLCFKNTYQGFNWSDFCQKGDSLIHANTNRGGVGYLADVQATKKYIDCINTHLEQHRTMLAGFIRGHQDRSFGCKMLFKPEKCPQLLGNTIACPDYPNGPFHWTDVVISDAQQKSSFKVCDYVPVFTFSTATEGQGVPYDCFGILTLGETFEQCVMDIYEIPLGDNNIRNGAYVSLKSKQSDQGADIINVMWTKDSQKHPIDQELIAKAQTQ